LANIIKNIAIHDLKKSEAGFDVVPGKGGLAVTETIQEVIDGLHGLYAKRGSKSHGRFSTDADNYPTQTHLQAYLVGRRSARDFATLTGRLMATLRIQAQRKPGATGGHVFFAHVEREGQEFLLVTIVNDKLGAAMTQDLDVRRVRHLDIDGFRFAGRIDISAWVGRAPRYIGFLKGKGDVSDYFREFLGCEITLQDREDTVALVSALKRFADEQGMEAEVRDQFLRQAKTICDRSARDNAELDFTAFANELTPDSPDVLRALLTDPDLHLNDGFVPDRRALGTLVKFKAKTTSWTLEFEREALTSRDIQFNAEANSLTITNLPDDLTERLRAEYDPNAEA
jgi:nucleoid-associated protein